MCECTSILLVLTRYRGKLKTPSGYTTCVGRMHGHTCNSGFRRRGCVTKSCTSGR